MKANELTIGDLVKIKDAEFPDHAQVNGIIKKHGAYYAMFGDSLTVIVDKIEAIPLTMDILLKNGFTKKFDYKCTLFYEDYYDLYAWEFNDGMWQICGHSKEFAGIPDQQVDVCYVHELQHALRLFGIDKEIEL